MMTQNHFSENWNTGFEFVWFLSTSVVKVLNTTKTEYIFVGGVAGFVAYK